MTVQIDMDMPKGCSFCPIPGYEDICPLIKYKYIIGYDENRHPDCPLKEVK